MTIDLDTLAARLGPKGRATEAHLRVRWSRSRGQQGELLKEYQHLYKPLGLFGDFLKAVGLPSKTAYRLIEDATLCPSCLQP